MNPDPVIITCEDEPAWIALGEIWVSCGAGLATLTDDCAVGSVTPEKFPSFAETTTADVGGTAGAVYAPLASIVPQLASPPAIPFTIQATEPINGEVNVTLWPVISTADEGLRVRLTGEVLGVPALWTDVEVEDLCVGVPQATQNNAATSPMDMGPGLVREYKLDK